MKVEQKTYIYNRGSIPIALKVHNNPCLQTINKTVVATITVHSSINSKSNC